MKKIYAIFLLGLYAANLSAASAADGEIVAGAAAGSARPPYYRSVVPSGPADNQKIAIEIEGLPAKSPNTLEGAERAFYRTVTFTHGYIFLSAGCFDNLNIAALRESIFRLHRGERALPSHPQTCPEIIRAMLDLKGLTLRDAARIYQMVNIYTPLSAAPEVLVDLMRRPEEELFDREVRKNFLGFMDKVLSVHDLGVEEQKRIVKHKDFISAKADILKASGHLKALRSQDLELGSLLSQEGDELFRDSIELYARAARLGDDASLRRLTDLLMDQSTTWAKSTTYPPTFTTRIKRVNTKQVHMDLALAKLNRSDSAVADALAHLDAYYDGAFQARLREAMADLSVVTPKSNWEQVIFQLFSRKNPVASHAFMDAYKSAIATNNPAAAKHQKLIVRFMDKLRAHGKDPKSHYLVKEFLAATACVPLDFPELEKLFGIFGGLAKGDKLVSARDIHLTLALEKLRALPIDGNLIPSLEHLNKAYNKFFSEALPEIMAHPIAQDSLLEETIFALFRRKHGAKIAFLGAYRNAVASKSNLVGPHQQLMVRFMAKLRNPQTDLTVKEFLAATAEISMADPDFTKIYRIFKQLHGRGLVSPAHIHLTLALEKLSVAGSLLQDPLSNLDKAYNGNFKAALPEIIGRVVESSSSLEGKALVALLRRGYEPARTAFIGAYEEVISRNGNIDAFQSFMTAFMQDLPADGQANALSQEFLDKTASIQARAQKYRNSMEWLRVAVNNLWERQRDETRALARPFLRKWAQVRHENHIMAISHLVASPLAEDHEILRLHVAAVLENDQATPNDWEYYIKCLLKSSVEEDGLLIRPYVRRILYGPAVAHAFYGQFDPRISKIDALLNSPLDSNHDFVRDFIQRVFTDDLPGHNRERYIAMLRESNNHADQELGVALKIQYYPVRINDTEVQRKMAMFNTARIKKGAPKPLPDLSATEMDLVGRFTALMDQIDTKNRFGADGSPNPSYIHVGAIDGTMDHVLDQNNAQAMLQIKRKLRSFLKSLEGKPFEPGEDTWPMYDGNKPATINALKNIVLALEHTMVTDQPTAFNNLGVVIRGLLYCPSGQSEGISSAVNTLIHGQNVLASDLSQKMDRVMHGAVQKAFLKAFHGGGEVHALARARMVFGPHIGVIEGIVGFEERISTLDDREIPGLYRDFYNKFTREHIVAEFRRNILSAEEYAYDQRRKHWVNEKKNLRQELDSGILEPAQRACVLAEVGEIDEEIPALDKRHKFAKQARPIAIAEIADWLRTHDRVINNEEAGDYGFTAYGINSDRTEISDEGIWLLLEDMGYVNKPVAPTFGYGYGGAAASAEPSWW